MSADQLYAHSKNQQGKWHLLSQHLFGVGEIMRRFSEDFYNGKVSELAWLIGIIHDLGKVHPGFQEYLKAQTEGMKHPKVPHSPWSASFVYRVFENFQGRHMLALPVAGHHSGLGEHGGLQANICENYCEQGILEAMFKTFKETVEIYPHISIPSGLTDLQRELLVRMLFSALIDADRIDTEKHFQGDNSFWQETKPTLIEMYETLQDNQMQLISQSEPSLVNLVRREVYENCLASAGGSPGFYRLTVPTGGGKTRSALAFALKHALSNNQRRIVFGIPYTSIIDQTASIFRDILGERAVLEHHSQVIISDDEDESTIHLRLAEENWDFPLIVTTTVQLFESLFANGPSRCRKIHNLAKSVIVLDEAQSLPVHLLKPTLQVLRDLVENYETTVVLSTATQPALQSEYLPELQGIEIKEIVPDFKKHFNELKRVSYQRLPGLLTIEELSQEIHKHDQVLVVLNSRKDALELVDALKGKNVYHLSTLLCGAHRRQVLEEVRRCLKDKQRVRQVRLISTQVVEAGVDLDFPTVYRVIGPLDRIVQAAGRCNREGRMPKLGRIVLFELQEGRHPRGPYKAGIEEARMLLEEYKTLDVLGEPHIYEIYFSRLYKTLGNDMDIKRIQKKREKMNFPETDKAYRLIEEETVPVVVRYGRYEEALEAWLKCPNQNNWRKLQQFIVNVFAWEGKGYIKDGLMSELIKGLYIWEGGYDNLKGIGGFQRDPSDLIV
jgi:CRISPR-associated endonuclease/helicase Cas3